MKKYILISIPTFLGVVIFFLYVSYPNVIPQWFRVRHVLIYLLFVYLVGVGVFALYQRFFHRLDDKPNRILPLRVLTILSTIILLFGGSQLQLYLIHAYEVPPLLGCVYYDDYDNLIYSSQYPGTCPEIDVTNETWEDDEFYYESIHVEVIEETSGSTPQFDYENSLTTVIDIIYQPFPKDNENGYDPTHQDMLSIRIDTIENSLQTLSYGINVGETELHVTRRIQIVENTFASDVLAGDITEMNASSTRTEYLYWGRYSPLEQVILPDETTLEPVQSIRYDIDMIEVFDQSMCTMFDDEDNGSYCYYYDVTFAETDLLAPTPTPVVFAEGERRHSSQHMDLNPQSLGDRTLRYSTSYGYSSWRYSQAQVYDLVQGIQYPFDDTRVGYSYTRFETVNLDIVSPRVFHYKDVYTHLPSLSGDPVETNVKLYFNDGLAYLIDRDFSVLVYDTTYGMKLSYYSTMRDNVGRYTIYPSAGVKSYYDLTTSVFQPLFTMYNYKAQLYDVNTYKPYYMIPQNLYLIYCIPTISNVFTVY